MRAALSYRLSSSAWRSSALRPRWPPLARPCRVARPQSAARAGSNQRPSSAVSGVVCSLPCLVEERSRCSTGGISALNYLIFHAGVSAYYKHETLTPRVSWCNLLWRPLCTYIHTTDTATAATAQGFPVQKT